MSKGCSFVQMSSDRVRELALQCAARVDEERLRMRSSYLKEIADEMSLSWWRKLLRRPPPSEGEVMDAYHRRGDGWFSLEDIVRGHGTRKMIVIGRLLNATEHADVVNVSTSDLSAIT